MGAINTSYTFTATDVITSTKMNNILDQSTITATAIIGTTLAVSAGKLSVAAGGIKANELAANAVTTTAILDANVTTTKIADASVTTLKIADSNVTTAKILDANVTTAKILDANVTTAKILDANITAEKLNGSQTGTAPIYGVRSSGSITQGNPRVIRKGFNVASAVRPDSSSTSIVFSTAMPDNNYIVSCGYAGTAGIAGAPPAAKNLTITGFDIAHNTETVGRETTFIVIG
jgi:hypothetical protein